MVVKARLGAVAWACVFCFASCTPEEAETPDVGVEDVGPDVVDEPDGPFVIEDPYDLVPFQPHVDSTDGHPDIENGRPAAGEVRVGRIKGSETGFSGVWSHCRSGDFLLSNHDVKVCIQSETTNRYETYTGGKFVDARRYDQRGGEDVLDMIMPMIDFGTATADNVEVVRDGSDGVVAVLRVTGQDIELAHLTGVVGFRVGTRRSIQSITEYRLYPDSPLVEIVTHLRAPSGREYRNLNIGEWFAYGDRARPWTPERGFGVSTQAMPWLGAIGDGHSFGVVFEDTATPMGLASLQGIPYAEMRVAQMSFSHEEPAIFRRWFVVGDGTMDSVREGAALARGEELEGRQVPFVLRDEAGEAVVGAEVVVLQENRWISVAHSDEAGALSFRLTNGEYLARVSNIAGTLEVERTFEVGDAGEVELTLPQVAAFTLTVHEAGTEVPITSRVRMAVDGLPVWHDYAVAGTLETVVPVGDLSIVVTRGLEYELYAETFSLSAGQHVEHHVDLARTVNTEGWRSGDFHQHMEPSIDSRANVYLRVLENASQGVELVVPTDHEVITDLQPVIDALGLTQELSTFPGVEISPLYAHFNLYPVPYRPDLRGRGSISLAYRADREVHLRRMPEIIEMARQWSTDPIVQMNHPRNNSGMFNHVNFDPELGPDEVTHEDFTIDIDTIEVINRYGHICMVLADWSGLLNVGLRVTGLGNSDSHSINGEAGVPRNYLRTDRAPGEIDADTARQVLRAGQVTVGSHAFIDFGDGTLPGDEVQVDGQGRATFHVRVQTAPWAEAQTLFVIVNGHVVETIERTAAAGAAFDFDEQIEVEVDKDSWVIFWADGPQPTAPIPNRKKLIAFTNPVYLLTGEGPWTAPGAGPLDLAAIDTGYCD